MLTSHRGMRKLIVTLVMLGMVLGMNMPLWAEENSQININTASAEELATLKNVGDKTAERIIVYRQTNGPFETVEELTNVKGIGGKTIEKNQGRMTVGSN